MYVCISLFLSLCKLVLQSFISFLDKCFIFVLYLNMLEYLWAMLFSRIFWRKFRLLDWWIVRAGVRRRKQFALKFRFALITFDFLIFNWFTSYSHTMLLRSRHVHHHVASWPWPSDNLDIQHCSFTIDFKVLMFSYNLFISWPIYFIPPHSVALVETFTLTCHRLGKQPFVLNN